MHNEMRTYRISRLAGAHKLGETFERKAAFDLAGYWEKSTEQFKASLPRYAVRLKLKELLLSRLKQERYVRVLNMMPLENGWIEAETEFHTLDSACEMLLGFGSLVEVVEPVELRAKILSEAKAILDQYSFPQNLFH